LDYIQPITRAEFAGLAVRAYEQLANTSIVPAVNNPFTDTDDEDVLKAFEAGIMIGYSQTMFMPDVELNREQCATALTRVFKRAAIPGWSFENDALYPLTFVWPDLFTDDEFISDWARESVYFMASREILLGIGNNRFAPRNTTAEHEVDGYATARREQAIAITVRMINKLMD